MAVYDTDPETDELAPFPPMSAGAEAGTPPAPTVIVYEPDRLAPVTTLTSPPPPPAVDPAPPPPTISKSAVTALGNVMVEVPTVVKAYTAYTSVAVA
jgi:hypothetical protein